jgi:hypothetical protein
MTHREDIVTGKLQWYKMFYLCSEYPIKWRREDSERDSFLYLYSKGHVGRHVWGQWKTLVMTENCKVMMVGVWTLTYGIEKCQKKQ